MQPTKFTAQCYLRRAQLTERVSIQADPATVLSLLFLLSALILLTISH
jgi:hypothetical protein